MEQSFQSSCEWSRRSGWSFLGGRRRKTRGPTNALLCGANRVTTRVAWWWLCHERNPESWIVYVKAPKSKLSQDDQPIVPSQVWTTKRNRSGVTADPIQKWNRDQTDPTRSAHLSLRTLSCVCAGTSCMFAATGGQSQEDVFAEYHQERPRGAGAVDFTARALLNWRASSQLKCLHTP